MERVLCHAFAEVMATAQEEQVTLRTAALMVAIGCVTEAMNLIPTRSDEAINMVGATLVVAQGLGRHKACPYWYKEVYI